MAYNALTRFGIKEVADVKFYQITGETEAGVTHAADASLVLDTLKVSNIESTAETAEARGGKGNAALISWDYGREITVSLEDALLSMETLALMFENDFAANAANGIKEVVINANKFPGTYYVEGTTFARNEVDGKDHLFTFIIPKAKIQSETTLTMEAEGDPTVFNMSLKVLRCKDGTMMKLQRADAAYSEDAAEVKVHVTLVSATGQMTNYELVAGEAWPTGVDYNDYVGMPATVAAGTYYEATT